MSMKHQDRMVIPRAVALRYRQSQDAAPRVVARGRGAIARKIMEIADSHGIPVLHNSALLDFLMSVEVEGEIPEIAFRAVAEIYAFLIEMDRKYEVVLD